MSLPYHCTDMGLSPMQSSTSAYGQPYGCPPWMNFLAAAPISSLQTFSTSCHSPSVSNLSHNIFPRASSYSNISGFHSSDPAKDMHSATLYNHPFHRDHPSQSMMLDFTNRDSYRHFDYATSSVVSDKALVESAVPDQYQLPVSTAVNHWYGVRKSAHSAHSSSRHSTANIGHSSSFSQPNFASIDQSTFAPFVDASPLPTSFACSHFGAYDCSDRQSASENFEHSPSDLCSLTCQWPRNKPETLNLDNCSTSRRPDAAIPTYSDVMHLANQRRRVSSREARVDVSKERTCITGEYPTVPFESSIHQESLCADNRANIKHFGKDARIRELKTDQNDNAGQAKSAKTPAIFSPGRMVSGESSSIISDVGNAGYKAQRDLKSHNEVPSQYEDAAAGCSAICSEGIGQSSSIVLGTGSDIGISRSFKLEPAAGHSSAADVPINGCTAVAKNYWSRSDDFSNTAGQKVYNSEKQPQQAIIMDGSSAAGNELEDKHCHESLNTLSLAVNSVDSDSLVNITSVNAEWACKNDEFETDMATAVMTECNSKSADGIDCCELMMKKSGCSTSAEITTLDAQPAGEDLNLKSNYEITTATAEVNRASGLFDKVLTCQNATSGISDCVVPATHMTTLATEFIDCFGEVPKSELSIPNTPVCSDNTSGSAPVPPLPNELAKQDRSAQDVAHISYIDIDASDDNTQEYPILPKLGDSQTSQTCHSDGCIAGAGVTLSFSSNFSESESSNACGPECDDCIVVSFTEGPVEQKHRHCRNKMLPIIRLQNAGSNLPSDRKSNIDMSGYHCWPRTAVSVSSSSQVNSNCTVSSTNVSRSSGLEFTNAVTTISATCTKPCCGPKTTRVRRMSLDFPPTGNRFSSAVASCAGIAPAVKNRSVLLSGVEQVLVSTGPQVAEVSYSCIDGSITSPALFQRSDIVSCSAKSAAIVSNLVTPVQPCLAIQSDCVNGELHRRQCNIPYTASRHWFSRSNSFMPQVSRIPASAKLVGMNCINSQAQLKQLQLAEFIAAMKAKPRVIDLTEDNSDEEDPETRTCELIFSRIRQRSKNKFRLSFHRPIVRRPSLSDGSCCLIAKRWRNLRRSTIDRSLPFYRSFVQHMLKEYRFNSNGLPLRRIPALEEWTTLSVPDDSKENGSVKAASSRRSSREEANSAVGEIEDISASREGDAYGKNRKCRNIADVCRVTRSKSSVKTSKTQSASYKHAKLDKTQLQNGTSSTVKFEESKASASSKCMRELRDREWTLLKIKESGLQIKLRRIENTSMKPTYGSQDVNFKLPSLNLECKPCYVKVNRLSSREIGGLKEKLKTAGCRAATLSAVNMQRNGECSTMSCNEHVPTHASDKADGACRTPLKLPKAKNSQATTDSSVRITRNSNKSCSQFHLSFPEVVLPEFTQYASSVEHPLLETGKESLLEVNVTPAPEPEIALSHQEESLVCQLANDGAVTSELIGGPANAGHKCSEVQLNPLVDPVVLDRKEPIGQLVNLVAADANYSVMETDNCVCSRELDSQKCDSLSQNSDETVDYNGDKEHDYVTDTKEIDHNNKGCDLSTNDSHVPGSSVVIEKKTSASVVESCNSSSVAAAVETVVGIGRSSLRSCLRKVAGSPRIKTESGSLKVGTAVSKIERKPAAVKPTKPVSLLAMNGRQPCRIIIIRTKKSSRPDEQSAKNVPFSLLSKNVMSVLKTVNSQIKGSHNDKNAISIMADKKQHIQSKLLGWLNCSSSKTSKTTDKADIVASDKLVEKKSRQQPCRVSADDNRDCTAAKSSRKTAVVKCFPNANKNLLQRLISSTGNKGTVYNSKESVLTIKCSKSHNESCQEFCNERENAGLVPIFHRNSEEAEITDDVVDTLDDATKFQADSKDSFSDFSLYAVEECLQDINWSLSEYSFSNPQPQTDTRVPAIGVDMCDTSVTAECLGSCENLQDCSSGMSSSLVEASVQFQGADAGDVDDRLSRAAEQLQADVVGAVECMNAEQQTYNPTTVITSWGCPAGSDSGCSEMSSNYMSSQSYPDDRLSQNSNVTAYEPDAATYGQIWNSMSRGNSEGTSYSGTAETYTANYQQPVAYDSSSMGYGFPDKSYSSTSAVSMYTSECLDNVCSAVGFRGTSSQEDPAVSCSQLANRWSFVSAPEIVESFSQYSSNVDASQMQASGWERAGSCSMSDVAFSSSHREMAENREPIWNRHSHSAVHDLMAQSTTNRDVSQTVWNSDEMRSAMHADSSLSYGDRSSVEAESSGMRERRGKPAQIIEGVETPDATESACECKGDSESSGSENTEMSSWIAASLGLE